ncbi:MAG: class I SAM-dependent methyltransferase [Candidatus Nanopelagicales bacterium]
MSRLSDIAERVRGRARPTVQEEPAPEPVDMRPPVALRDAIMSGWFRNDEDELFRGFPVSADDVVVDVGCGDGRKLGFCAKRGAHVIAVDIDAEALELAREEVSDTPARVVEVHEARAEALPIADGTATRVICSEVLEHVDDPRVVVAELVRVAAPGALILATCPDPLHEQMQSHIAPASYFEKPNHIRRIERDELASWFREAGLQIVEQDTYGFYWSIWLALYWAVEADLADADNPLINHAEHPLLDQWASLWQDLLDTERGRELKAQLDDFLPMSQLIVARKPE